MGTAFRSLSALRLAELSLVILFPLVIAFASARDFAGSWNDGSRLATVECLVDYGTLAIDRSIFILPHSPDDPQNASPYPADDIELVTKGTGDKLLIEGHYYSDKSPTPALFMSGIYKILQTLTGLQARDNPASFCYWMTVSSSGLAYVFAVWWMHRTALGLGLGWIGRLLLTGGLALTTVALPYARHVNNHILLLAIAAGLVAVLCNSKRERLSKPIDWSRHLWIGTLSGLGYTIDLGAGPVLLLCTIGLTWYRRRRWAPVAVLLGAAPWLTLHHVLNYHIGGTLKPANAVAEYFQWPGSVFDSTNLTGSWNHRSMRGFLTYAAALLVGKRGFISHNLALYLAVPGALLLLRRRVAEAPELVFALCWCGGTWLAYALTSNNYAGVCCSIRWFVPLLAPGYYMLALFLRQYPAYWRYFLVLSAWGAVLAALMWWRGPWMKHMAPLFWPIQAAALLSWIISGISWSDQSHGAPQSATVPRGRAPRAA
jgi:hypothetical protein